MKNIQAAYQQCSRCVMDTTAADITFDAGGFCNYCTEFLLRSSHIINGNSAQKEEKLKTLVAQVKASGKSKPYDCIVGVSGGVDSSWTLVEVKRLGLRPLAVHMDNGWNSELAQNNIANLVRELDVDLFTYVIDWQEYRDLMQAFFDADVIDVELLYDNAMLAVNYQQAAKYGLKYILAGTNQATEGMLMAKNWFWCKYDEKNIRAIAKAKKIKLKTFPAISNLKFLKYNFYNKINWVSFLDFTNYSKGKAISFLEKKHGFKKYPYKHYESIFTRFYQGYLLPKKFNVDKRKHHLSVLILTNQINRESAIEDLKNNAYDSEESLNADKKYFLKKMHWEENNLSNYLNRPEKPHDFYPSEVKFHKFLKRLKKLF